MPEMDGMALCRRIKADPSRRHIPIIFITGRSEMELNVEALEVGAEDFLTKPFDPVLLLARIRNALRTKYLQDQLISYQRQLESSNERLESAVSDRTRQVERIQQVAVFSLAKLAESRDTETGDHLERVRSYTRVIASGLRERGPYRHVITDGFVEALYRSMPLHDIGKVGIPDSILLKPGALSKEEFDVMKTHTQIGGDTLRAADSEAGGDLFLAMGRDIAYHHHEKWDGGGYPFGKKGEDIPLPARIAAVSDVYDALSSKRPYKEAFSHEKSRAIIMEGRGNHFDPAMVDAFLEHEEEFVTIRTHFQSTGKLSPLEEKVSLLNQLRTAN
jgi:putative two-component system response regulator